MSREKSFIKNTAVYMIGSLSSKLLVFLLLPIYTKYLTTEEYGYYDIIYTTVSLIFPMISLQIYDGIYRFVLDTQNDTTLINKYISNALIIVGIAFIATVPLLGILQLATNIEYLNIIYLQIIMTSIFNIWQMIARGLKKNNLFAVSGIIMTATMLFLNILFIVVFHFSVKAMIVSNVIALAIAVLFLEYKLRITKIFKFSYISKDIIKQLISYSLPLVPNSISWWILNLSNRYIIIFYLGNDFNGIYAVASKFPSIIMMVNMVFNLAWQDTAIFEKDAKDREQFYSKMFNCFLEMQLALLIIIIPFIKIFSFILIGKDFYDSINYIPILMLATFFQCFTTFFCSFYYLNKKTLGLLYTTLIGAAANIVITIIFISKIELYATSMATVFSTIMVVVLRYIYIRRIFKIEINIKVAKLLFYIILLSLHYIIYYNASIYLNAIMLLISTIGLGIANKNYLVKCRGIILKKYFRVVQINK